MTEDVSCHTFPEKLNVVISVFENKFTISDGDFFTINIILFYLFIYFKY